MARNTASLRASKLRDSGRIADGMLPKAAAIDAALGNGVERVHVISYRIPDSLLLEVFTNEGTGTLVVNDVAALTAAEQAPAAHQCSASPPSAASSQVRGRAPVCS